MQLETGPEIPPASGDRRVVAVASLRRTARTGRVLPASLVTETMLRITARPGRELPVWLWLRRTFRTERS